MHIDLFIAGWCGVIPASAIIYIGNHQRNGMSEMEYQKKMYALKKMKKLTYQSEETQESVLEILEEEISMKKAQENDIPKKKVKFPIQRMIKMAMLIGIVVQKKNQKKNQRQDNKKRQQRNKKSRKKKNKIKNQSINQQERHQRLKRSHEQERRQRQKEESQEKKKQRLTEQGAVKVQLQ